MKSTAEGTTLDNVPYTRALGSPRSEGFTLAALIVILTIIAIIIAYTVPEQWSMIMKRERDRQTIFLMKQYARAHPASGS